MFFWNSCEYCCVCFLSIPKISQERNYSNDSGKSADLMFLSQSPSCGKNRILPLRLKKHQHKCKCLAWIFLKGGHYVYGGCCRVPGSCQQELNHPVHPAVVDQVSQHIWKSSLFNPFSPWLFAQPGTSTDGLISLAHEVPFANGDPNANKKGTDTCRSLEINPAFNPMNESVTVLWMLAEDGRARRRTGDRGTASSMRSILARAVLNP